MRRRGCLSIRASAWWRSQPRPQKGLQRVEELRPDVTLVDIDLGEESGFDVVEKLHRNGSGAAVPTILISTHAEEDFAELVAASPALAFIPKAALSGSAIRDVLGLAG